MNKFMPVSILSILLWATTQFSFASDMPIYDDIGGDFVAQGSNGKKVSLSQQKGKVVLLFFGYTNCPDACPVTLAYITKALAPLGDIEKQVQVLFVTVDPELDTAIHLNSYLKHFNSSYLGITGTRDEVDNIAGLFKARYERKSEHEVTTSYNRHKSNSETFHVYAHSQQIYLIDKEGNTRGLFFTGAPMSELQTSIRQLASTN